MFRIGDEVEVVGQPHSKGHSRGIIVSMADTPAYAIRFHGSDEIHKWYVGSELRRADHGVGAVMDRTEAAKMESAFGYVLESIQKLKKTLSARDLRILQIGMRASHIEEAMAQGEFDRARSHFHELLKLTEGL